MLTPIIPTTTPDLWQFLTPSQRTMLHRLRHTNCGWSASVSYTDALHALWMLGIVRINGYARDLSSLAQLLGDSRGPQWRRPVEPLLPGHLVMSGLTDTGRLVLDYQFVLRNPITRQEWRA